MKENKGKDHVNPKQNQTDDSITSKEEEHVADKEEPNRSLRLNKRTTRNSNVKEEGFYKFNSMMLRSMSSQSKTISPAKARKRLQKHAKSVKEFKIPKIPEKRYQRKKSAQPHSHWIWPQQYILYNVICYNLRYISVFE